MRLVTTESMRGSDCTLLALLAENLLPLPNKREELFAMATSVQHTPHG